MAQLYTPPLGRLLRSLLLQCVIMLGLVSAIMAQAPTTNTTVSYEGPWLGSTQGGKVTSNKLVTDGDDLAPSTIGGSAQLRYTDSYVNVKLQDAGNIGQTGYKVSYSLKASTTRSSYNAKVRVSYQLYEGESETNVSEELVSVTTTTSRNSLYLPNNATNIRFQLEEVTNAYVFLDAITVSQEPEIAGFTPALGLPKEVVTITGKHLNEATQVYFGDIVATPIDKADGMLTVAVPYGVKTDKITVVNPYGFVISENEFVVPAPVFNVTTAFNPGEAAPGRTITIYGQNLTGVNQVLFNGVAADPTTIKYEVETEDSEITVTIPLGATSGPLTIASPAGSTVSTPTFNVLGPQILAQEGEPNAGFEFYPVSGSAGDEVTLYGKYFLAVTEVQFNGIKATNLSVVNDSTIKISVPLGAGTGVIKVLAPAGEDESSVAFDVPAPKFADYDAESSKFQFSPNTAGPGMQIKLFGTNMSSVATVLFAGNNGAGVEATIAQPTRDDELTVTVPSDAETGTIRIIASGAGKEDESEQVFNFVPTPVIATVTTTTGGSVYGIVPAEGTTDIVKITGENFQTAEQVIFGSISLGLYNAETSPNGFQVNEAGTEITFPLVIGMATGSITVKTKGGEGAWEGPLEVIYQPSVVSISPTKGPLGRAITITGQYLKYVSEVTFLGSTEGAEQTVTLVTPNSKDNELVVTVPAGTTTGVLRLTNPAGTTITTQQYEVVLIPVITAFNPVEGVAGDEVTIEGYNFTNTTSVKFGALDAASFEIVSDELMTAVVPVGAETSLIEITNGVGPGTSQTEFKIIQKPTIATISPLRGIVGDIITITGTNFYGENLVVTFLGSEEADDETTVTIASANVNETYTQLTVAVPVGAVTGKLMVTNAAGDSEHSTDIYEIVTKPEIVSFNPIEGKVGDIVTITGWLLNEVTSVEFNGTPATPIETGRTAKSMTVAVPMEATTGPLALLVDGVEVDNTEENLFTVIPAPIITLVEKEGSGVAGTVVTITGSNFTGVTKVTFLGTAVASDDAEATPFTVNAEGTQIITTVPYAAVTGKIQVTAPAGTGISPENFIVPIPVFTSVSRESSYANELVTISGNYFTNMTRLTFNGKAADISGVTIAVDENGVESITVKAPFDAGTGPIALTTPAGVGSSSTNYTVIEPVITSISVNEGYAEQTTVTITGKDFKTYFNGTEVVSDATPVVNFNGAVAKIIGTPTDASITVEVPVGARTGSISVETPSGIGYSETFYILLPKINAYTINPAYAGQTVTITGDNFVDILGLTFKGVPVDTVSTVQSETGGTITFVAPFIEDPTRGGLGTLQVRTKTGSSEETNNFTVIKPSITAISPSKAYAGTDAQVTITGANFMGYYDKEQKAVSQANPIVRFNGSSTDATIVSATETQLVVAVPQDATTGAVTIRSGSGVRTQSSLTIIGAPTIATTNTFVANSGTAGSPVSTSFVINGTNFDQTTKVEFLGTTAEGDEVVMTSGFTVNAEGTQISLSVPTGAVAGPIAVTTPYNKGVNSVGTTVISETNFRVVNAPTITGIATTTGAVRSTVRINGTNLWDITTDGRTGKARVFFKTHNTAYAIPNEEEQKLEVEGIVSNYDDIWGTWLEVTVPANAISGTIRVENIVDDAMSTEAFDVTTPMIVHFEKGNGIIDENNAARLLETVFVKGYKLLGVGTIKIGSTSVRNFYEDTEYSLEMIVPNGATTNIVAITSTGGDEESDTELFINQPVIRFVQNSQDITGMKFSTEPGKVLTQSYTLSASYLAVGEETLSISFADGTKPYTALREGVDVEYSKGFDLTVDENGNVAAQVVTVRFAPEESGSYTTSLRHSTNLLASTKSLQLNGDAIIPLPVELIAFNARKEGNSVQLTWATASELDNDYFEVQMTEDLKGEFKAVGKVKSKVNTTSLRQDYQFNHKGNFNGTRYYRLKQVDLDGTFEYSKVVAVSSNGVNLAVGPRVYPNPINADSKLVYNADRAGKLNVRIVNMNGSAVQNLSYDIEEGENTILLNLNNNLPTGIYILMAEFNGKTEQVKLMKQ